MSYSPTNRAGLRPGVSGTASAWSDLVTDHDELYRIYGPPVLAEGLVWTETATSASTRVRFRLRVNADLRTVAVWVRAKCSAAGGVVTVNVGAASGTVTVSSSTFRWQVVEVTPAASGTLDCTVQTHVASGTLTVTGGPVVYVFGGPPASGARSSGFARAAGLAASNYPISSEHVTRLLHGPVVVAIDRPACIARHVSDAAAAVTTKSYGAWGAYNATTYQSVGRLYVPTVEEAPRTVRLDAYTDRDGTGEVRIEALGHHWSITSTGWSSTTWTLPPGAGHHGHAELTCQVLPGASKYAVLRTLQIWRVPV